MQKFIIFLMVFMFTFSFTIFADEPNALGERESTIDFHYHNIIFKVKTLDNRYCLKDILKGFGIKEEENKLDLRYSWILKDNTWYKGKEKRGLNYSGYIDIDLINEMFLTSSRKDDSNIYLSDIEVIYELNGEEPFNNSFLKDMVIEDSAFKAEIRSLYNIKDTISPKKLIYLVDGLKFGKLPLSVKRQFFNNTALNLSMLDK